MVYEMSGKSEKENEKTNEEEIQQLYHYCKINSKTVVEGGGAVAWWRGWGLNLVLRTSNYHL